MHKELKAVQDRLLEQGVLDVKFAVYPEYPRDLEGLERLKTGIARMLNAHLDGKHVPYTPIGD